MRPTTGESGTGIDLSPIRELERRLDNFRIDVDADITVRGSAWSGYAFHFPTCEESGFGGGGGGGPPIPGACCLSDGTCEVVTRGQCLLDGGTFFGGVCDPSPCPGACCKDDGTCEYLSESDCGDVGGTFQGVGTDCDTTGACCIDTDCSITTESCCTNAGGTYQGDDTTCAPNPCLVTGACCNDNVCDEGLTLADCESGGGLYVGNGTTCTPNPCTQCFVGDLTHGACCSVVVGTIGFTEHCCLLISSSDAGDCVTGGSLCPEGEECTYLGNGTDCIFCDPVAGDICGSNCCWLDNPAESCFFSGSCLICPD